MPSWPITIAGHAGADSLQQAEPDRLALPIAPVAVLLLGTPVWWLLGIGLFTWPLFAGAMALLLLVRRDPLRFPAAFGLWLAFLAWMLTSGLMLIGEPDPSLEKFAGNALLYGSATVVFLYAYALGRDPARRRGLVLVLAGFFSIIVLGGWFALAFPDFSLTTPVQRLLPGLNDANAFIARRIAADSAVQSFLGSRPRAPFGETNEWGANMALTLPFAIAALAILRSVPMRLALAALTISAVVPLAESRNRGAWAAIALIAAYALLRFGIPALRRVPRAGVAAGAAVGLVAVVALALSPLPGTIRDRIENRGGGDRGRAASYREALTLATDSPIFGYATTQDEDRLQLPAGTHGQGFRVLVSHGFPALMLFVGFFGWIAWRTRDGPAVTISCHLCLLTALIAMAYYNLLPAQIHVMLLAAAIGMQSLRGNSPVAGVRAPA